MAVIFDVEIVMAFQSDVNDPKIVAGFLTKTFDIFSRPEHQQYCGWGAKGDSIVIKQTEQFSKNVIPKYFKHSNFQSFVRQLNMYDFRKTLQDPNHVEFYHPLFKLGHPELLVNIKRKVNPKEMSQANKPLTQAIKPVVNKSIKKKDKDMIEEYLINDDVDLPLKSATPVRSSARFAKSHFQPQMNLDNEHDINFEDDGQFLDNSYGILNSAKTAMIELSNLDLTRNEVEHRFKSLEKSTMQLAAENMELKAMMEEAAAKQANMERRMENVLRTLFNIFTKNGTIPGVSISKIIEDSSAQDGSVPLISSYGENGINEVCNFLGIPSPRSKPAFSAISDGPASTNYGGQELMKLPSFDTGVARITAPGPPSLPVNYKPNLERQSSLDWFRSKEDTENESLITTLKDSENGSQLGLTNSETVGLKRSLSGVDTAATDAKKTKVDVPSDGNAANPTSSELALLERNLNLTLKRVDTIELAIANFFGSETPKSPKDSKDTMEINTNTSSTSSGRATKTSSKGSPRNLQGA